MFDIDKEIDHMIDNVEGGYVNDPSDPGGETIWGMTIAVARANGYVGRMRDMTKDIAKVIYKKQYWLKPKFDQVAVRYPRVAAELFDTGVNAGVARASEFLQRVLNVLNDGGRLYADIVPDGQLGPASLTALDGYMRARGKAGEDALVRYLDALQGNHYITLAERSSKFERFMYGWAKRLANA